MYLKHSNGTVMGVIISAFAPVFLFLAVSFFTFPMKAYALGNSRGEYLFNYYNCIDCHEVEGIGGTLGPSLSDYGSENKSYGWTAAQIENPQSHYSNGSKVEIKGRTYLAVMPSYNYIPSGDVTELVNYLNSLRK